VPVAGRVEDAALPAPTSQPSRQPAEQPLGRLLAIRAGLAVLGGTAVGLSFQPYGLWPLLLLGIPALTLAVRPAPLARVAASISSPDDARSVRLRHAFGLGYLFGLAMLGIAVNWIHVLGIWIAILLIVFESVFFGALGVALALTARLRSWPVAAACCWVLVEFAYSRIPFGGFGWTRLAYAAVDTPLAGFLPFVGVTGVSFLVALLPQLLAWVLIGSSRRRRLLVAAAVVAVLVGAGAGLSLLPPAAAAGSVNVGIVQGNVPGRGIEALGRMRSVTNNHLSETVNLMTRVRLGQAAVPDFILWPENSTDIDPTADPITRTTVQSAAEIAGRPIMVGAVMDGPGEDERQTSALWWDPQRGIVARYDKRNLVPFGEWIPFRRQLLPLLPILEKVGAQSVPGTKPGVLEVPVGGRTIRVGDAICFELAYDQTMYQVVRGGAQVLMVQSNNATYGGTGQIEQQFAITRARAMEARREIAVATTNSVSGLIDARGRVILKTHEFTAASAVVTMPIRTAITPAVVVAPWIDRALAATGLLCCLLAAIGGLQARSGQPRAVGEDGSGSTAAADPVQPARPPGG
jgi:apolipoprotein N-acyltransferase